MMGVIARGCGLALGRIGGFRESPFATRDPPLLPVLLRRRSYCTIGLESDECFQFRSRPSS